VYKALVRDIRIQALELKDSCLERLGMSKEAEETRGEINATMAPLRK